MANHTTTIFGFRDTFDFFSLALSIISIAIALFYIGWSILGVLK